MLAASISTLLMLGALEGACRLLGIDPSRHEVWRRDVGVSPFTRPSEELPTVLLKPGVTWGHRYSSNERGYFGPDDSVQYRTNSSGWRGDEFELERTPAVSRIALLGDSFAFGEGVRREDTVAARLPDLLRRRTGCGVELYNFAVPGYDTIDEAIVLDKVVTRYRPDVVVLWYFLNDTETTGTMGFLGGNEPVIFFPWARSHSALARFAGARLDAYALSARLIRVYHDGYRPDGEKFIRMREALTRIGEWSRSHGVPVVVFVHPILYRLDAEYPFADIHSTVMDLCHSLGLPAHDLFEAFRGRDGPSLWVHAADQHPNQIAHAIAAEFAADRLAPLFRDCPRR